MLILPLLTPCQVSILLHFTPSLNHSIFSAKVVNREVFHATDWVIDTGATDHMVHSIACFTTITATLNTFVNLLNGEVASVTHVGIVKISEHLILHNVLCVPSFSFNLIFISQLVKSTACCLIFFGNLCFIQDLAHWSSLGLGRESYGLYLLDKSYTSTPVIAASVHSSQVHIWHSRLGHLSNAKLASIRPSDVPSFISVENFDCDICPLAKQKRLPFNKSSHLSKSCFELIYCDLWGPFSVSTIDHCRYFLTIVDDYSRCTWVYLLKRKSQTQTILEQFCTMVETKFCKKIKTLRSNNGTEFIMKDFFAKKGILHHLSCVETLQQNAIVERKHQHILNVARALMFHSYLPLHLWGHAILAVVYLINRIPSPALSNQIPFEVLFGHPPSYAHLKVFGCLYFASTLSNHRSKLHLELLSVFSWDILLGLKDI